MPSTLVHIGVAALFGSALLADHFDWRAIAIVMVVAAFPDIDTFIGLWIMDGAHRTVLHNIFFPILALGIVLWDIRWRSESSIRSHWGDYGVRVIWVSILAGWLVAHVLLDAFYNGVNLFWPVYDQFIDLSGALYFSTHEGFVQTFFGVEWTAEGIRFGESHVRGGTDETHYRTGVDLGPGASPGDERIFPIAESGELFLIALSGYLITAFRLWESRSEH